MRYIKKEKLMTDILNDFKHVYKDALLQKAQS